MNIETKFDIGQAVYTFRDPDSVHTDRQISEYPVSHHIQRWRVRSIAFDGDEITYELCCSMFADDNKWYAEKDVFSTSTDCVATLAHRRLNEARNMIEEWSAILNTLKE